MYLRKDEKTEEDKDPVPGNIVDATFMGEYLVYRTADDREHFVDRKRVARIETRMKKLELLAGLKPEEIDKLCSGGKESKEVLDKVLTSK